MNPICIFEYLVDLINWVAFWKINIPKDGGFDNPAYKSYKPETERGI